MVTRYSRRKDEEGGALEPAQKVVELGTQPRCSFSWKNRQLVRMIQSRTIVAGGSEIEHIIFFGWEERSGKVSGRISSPTPTQR